MCGYKIISTTKLPPCFIVIDMGPSGPKKMEKRGTPCITGNECLLITVKTYLTFCCSITGFYGNYRSVITH